MDGLWHDLHTTYRKDYVRWRVDRVQPLKPADTGDALSSAFKRYLVSHDALCQAPPPVDPHLEHPGTFLDRVRGQLPWLDSRLGTEPQECLVRLQELPGVSTYVGDFCGGERAPKPGRVSLPEGWKVPATTYQAGYRLHSRTFPSALQRQQGSLGPNNAVRQLLSVRTGDSEYEAGISATGRLVMDDQLHGPP
ncbi:uncharacterized protein LOC134536178 [Bacillus rossius redtenbacheri]|uniref:uncharacterized protein LOC134536178 n=1 Tax=Bacillus rossius redtenbacheri TaxID=93214 RepID=UPI002FDD7416